MSTKLQLLFILLVTSAHFSCQKQLTLDEPVTPGGSNNTLEGAYNLLNMRVKAVSTVTFSESGVQSKAITATDYTTKNNSGTVAITASQFTTTNLSYSIDTIVKVYFYADDLLIDQADAPFSFDMPPYNGNTTYTKIGTDSLSFQSGFINVPIGAGIPAQSAASGAKYSWSGNNLVLYTPFTINNTQDINGISAQILYQGEQWITLKKK
jgi:hypothetical protein